MLKSNVDHHFPHPSSQWSLKIKLVQIRKYLYKSILQHILRFHPIVQQIAGQRKDTIAMGVNAAAIVDLTDKAAEALQIRHFDTESPTDGHADKAVSKED